LSSGNFHLELVAEADNNPMQRKALCDPRFGAILKRGCGLKAFPIYRGATTDGQAVSLPIKSRRLEQRPDRTDVRYHDYRSMVQ
jgi:hypothetical protein